MRELGIAIACVVGSALSCALASACGSASEPVASMPTTPAAADAPLRSAADPSAAEQSSLNAVSPREPGDPQSATPPGSATSVPIYNAETTAIESTVSARFILALPANIATPMRWRLAPAATDGVLSAPSEAYHDAPPADCAGCTGYPGTRLLTFEALTPGKTTLHLAYGSLTDKTAKPERELTIDVVVK